MLPWNLGARVPCWGPIVGAPVTPGDGAIVETPGCGTGVGIYGLGVGLTLPPLMVPGAAVWKLTPELEFVGK